MVQAIAVLIAALLGTHAHAQTLRVVKVKGKRAIVETTSGTLTQGQTLTVGGKADDFGFDEDSSKTVSAGHTGPRSHFVGGSGGFSSEKSGTTTLTTFSLDALYGWNPGNNMEYGILANVGVLSGGGSNSTAFAAGGKFDWDFTVNKAPADGILSAGAEATFGSSSLSGTSTTLITVFPMGSYKWFLLGTQACVRVDAGLKIVQSSGKGSGTIDTNPAIRFGLFNYF